MALFKTPEERQASQEQKVERILARYGLQNIDPQYAEAVQKIALELAGSGLSEFGAILSNDDKAMNRAQTQFTRAILEQNFIIIRQLDQISYLLEQRLQ